MTSDRELPTPQYPEPAPFRPGDIVQRCKGGPLLEVGNHPCAPSDCTMTIHRPKSNQTLTGVHRTRDLVLVGRRTAWPGADRWESGSADAAVPMVVQIDTAAIMAKMDAVAEEFRARLPNASPPPAPGAEPTPKAEAPVQFKPGDAVRFKGWPESPIVKIVEDRPAIRGAWVTEDGRAHDGWFYPDGMEHVPADQPTQAAGSEANAVGPAPAADSGRPDVVITEMTLTGGGHAVISGVKAAPPPDAAPQFVAGTPVRLKGDGPIMTVVQTPSLGGPVDCVWFDSHSHKVRDRFGQDMLEVVPAVEVSSSGATLFGALDGPDDVIATTVSSDIDPGDVVRLASDEDRIGRRAVAMTVERVTSDGVRCVWFDSGEVLQRGRFAGPALVKVTPPGEAAR